MKRMLARLRHAARKCLEGVFFLFPVKKNKVLFINFNGKGFGCNPKYIALELLEQKLPYDMVWLADAAGEEFPQGIRAVRYSSVRALYEVATAKVVISNVKNDLRLIKKKGQYIIHTWHGSYCAKLVEREAEDKLSPGYIKESKHHSKICDLFLSNSRALSKSYRDSFWYDGEILECGFPRNDILFCDEGEKTAAVKQALGLPDGAKLALYAPTFRDDGNTACYDIDHAAILETLGESWYLLIRLHPNVGSAGKLFPFGGRLVDATAYPDMQELLVAADILITDYSSTVFEVASMEKPSFIYASDVEEYEKMRGLRQDFFTMPYPVCRSNEALLEQLRAFTPENGRELARRFSESFGSTDKGDASKQVAERIKSVIGEERL